MSAVTVTTEAKLLGEEGGGVTIKACHGKFPGRQGQSKRGAEEIGR